MTAAALSVDVDTVTEFRIRSRAQQGLPAVIEDEQILARVAAILHRHDRTADAATSSSTAAPNASRGQHGQVDGEIGTAAVHRPKRRREVVANPGQAPTPAGARRSPTP